MFYERQEKYMFFFALLFGQFVYLDLNQEINF